VTVRNILKIDESKCNGCGACVTACAEGAIAIIDGKARLVSETYCDGLGACIGHCPQDAITIEQREAPQFDDEAVKKHLAASAAPAARRFAEIMREQKQTAACDSLHSGGGCPGSAHRKLQKTSNEHPARSNQLQSQSELTHWPVQLKLVSPNAEFLKTADVLLAGDCIPFAMPDFHANLLRGRVLLVGCPKLDDAQYYVDKLAQIIAVNNLKSITVVHMEVPCCFGLVRIVEEAMKAAGMKVPLREVTVSLQGSVK
jgi:Pyruvate/2-oxoacid:ferredoxin oxidoreductase delta subunit